MSEGLFRKAAIDKVSSPEQLDLLMQVTSPAGWIALLTVFVSLIAIGFWAVFATIPELVDGNGTLFRGERLYDVKATMGGTLMMLEVRPGVSVTAGQVIARIQRTEARPEELRASQEKADSVRADIARIRTMTVSDRQTLTKQESQWRLEKQLVDQGIKAENDLRRIETEINQTKGRLEQYRTDIISKEAQMTSIAASLSSTIEVTSAEPGTVVEVIKSQGDKINDGDALVRFERRNVQDPQFCNGDLHALVYVPASAAPKIRKGHIVRVSPTGVERERYGFIFGTVDWVANYPASTADMNEKLKNDQLVKQFSGAGPVFETRVCLDKSPVKANALKWSSSEGPPNATEAGTTCTVSMVVDEKKPYTYVIPAVKRAVGM